MNERELLKRMVVMNVNNECKTYDEASKKEIGFGCKIVPHNNSDHMSEYIVYFVDFGKKIHARSCDDEDITMIFDEYEIDYVIGLPITIGRVMEALGSQFVYADIEIRRVVSRNGTFIIEINGIHWKLMKENGQECTDDDQSDETIEKILSFFQ